MIYLSAPLLSLFITISLIPLLIGIAGRINAFDIPDERKVHTEPIPRIGGIAIAAGVFVSMLTGHFRTIFCGPMPWAPGLSCSSGPLTTSGALIIRLSFPVRSRRPLLSFSTAGSKSQNSVTLLPDNALLPLSLSIPLTVVIIVGITNAINLADGLDGLAGGICLLSFCCIGYLAFLEDNKVIALLSLSLMGAVFAFLRFNTHPASLFMGDAGSQFLGFSLVATPLSLTQGDTALSPVLPLIIFGFPVLDTATVMLRRIAKGHSPFSADKQHFHHRLMSSGAAAFRGRFCHLPYPDTLRCAAFLLRFYSDWVLFIAYVFCGLYIIGLFHCRHEGFYGETEQNYSMQY